jgi:serine/threonine-protein kinase
MGADSTFAKGDRIDRFEIRELIGQGGMGAIYRAIDTKLGRTVALKVVRTDRLGSSSGEQARQRFLRETLAMSKVEHRNVVRVLDFGFWEDTPYLAMEYLRGQDLGQLLKATSGFLPIADVVDVMLEVCAAIRACHDAGIIHRDLKPSNIFLCDNESERAVKGLDFGVSKPPVAGELTREGQIVGTPQYLAPEPIEGKAVPQTDQYAVGVMLYACLTKTLPYQGHASFVLLRAIALGQFTAPCVLRAELPAKLEGIILRAMRTVADERFESIQELGRALWEFASPDAREKWRAYYFEERPRAAPKASTHAMPLIEALARGVFVQPEGAAPQETKINPEGPAAKPAAAPAADPFAGTALAESPAAVVAAARHALGRDSSVPMSGEPAPFAVEPAPTPDDPALTLEPKTRSTRRRAWALAGLVGAALAIGAGAWVNRQRATTAPAPTTEPPTTTRVPVAPPAAQEQRPAPAPAVPRALPPEPKSAPGVEPTRATEAVPKAPPARREKRSPRNKQARSPEQAGDGVPIMP